MRQNVLPLSEEHGVKLGKQWLKTHCVTMQYDLDGTLPVEVQKGSGRIVMQPTAQHNELPGPPSPKHVMGRLFALQLRGAFKTAVAYFALRMQYCRPGHRSPDLPAPMAHQSILGKGRQLEQEQLAQGTKVSRHKRASGRHTI